MQGYPDSKEKIFDELYLEHLKKIEYFSYSYLYDWEEAKEVAQDVFLKLWNRREMLSSEKEFFPYLFVLAKNESLNILRKRKAKANYADWCKNAELNFNISAIGQQNQVEIFSKEVQDLINKAIQNMPPKVRETFLLSRNANLKNREIAVVQSIGLSTVEARLTKAYIILRKYLKDYLPVLLWIFPTITL